MGSELKKIWTELRAAGGALSRKVLRNLIETLHYSLHDAPARDMDRWWHRRQCEIPGTETDTWVDQITRLYGFLVQRLKWMDDKLCLPGGCNIDATLQPIWIDRRWEWLQAHRPATGSHPCAPWNGDF